jgi:protoporphyrinogen/coproporphyrinogen III oxidase
MPDKKIDVAIIGGGLTGLSLGHFLKKEGKSIVVLEQSGKVGGVIQTHHQDGFVFESGPNTGVLVNEETVQLFDDLEPLCKLEKANPKAKNRWIWKGTDWHALPHGLKPAVQTPLFKATDKFRILGEPFRKKGRNPMESVADMVRRRLGNSFLQYAVDPFISGVYAGDPERLVTQFALPKLYALEQNYGSFIRGTIKKHKGLKHRTELQRRATREVISAEGGLGNLIHALETSVGKQNILCNTKNTSIHPTENGYSISVESMGQVHLFGAKRVVTTFGGPSLFNVLPFVPSTQIQPLAEMEYAKVCQTIIGYHQWKGRELNAFGGLVPSVEKRDVLGVLFTSSFFANRCPDGGVLLSVFMGGAKRPEIFDMEEPELMALARKEMKTMLGAIGEPDLMRVFKFPRAIPQYTAASKERLEAIEKIEREFPGLILAGNIRDGIGMADRVKQAADIAKSIV